MLLTICISGFNEIMDTDYVLYIKGMLSVTFYYINSISSDIKQKTTELKSIQVRLQK